MAEQLEAKLASGNNINIVEHSMLTNAIVKVAARIGIDRRARNVTPSLKDYLNQAIEDDPTSSIDDPATIEQVEVAP
jgi:exonuclease I